MTYSLILFAEYALTFRVILEWLGYTWKGISLALIFNATCVIAMASHALTMCTDPGAVPRNACPLSDDEEENDFEVGGSSNGAPFKKFCRKCNCFKPARAHHCSSCGRCVIKMDHHCPWVNNCVGIANHKLFILFCFWTCVSAIITLTVIIARFADCIKRKPDR